MKEDWHEALQKLECFIPISGHSLVGYAHHAFRILNSSLL